MAENMWIRVAEGRGFNSTKICKGKEEKGEGKKRLLAESMSTRGGMLR